MTSSFLRRGISILAAFALLVTLVPQSARASWISPPSNVDVVGSIYTNDTTPTVTWDRPSGATWFELLVDNGSWVSLSNVDSYTVWALADGWHTIYVRANNNYGDVSTSGYVTIEVDTEGPSVSTVSPSSADEDESTTLSVTTSGESAASSCSLYVDNSNVGSMSKSGSTFSTSYTFYWEGNYTVYARCADGDGNYTSGTSRTITVGDIDEDDDETFYVPSVSPSNAEEDRSTTISVTPYGTLDAVSCYLYVSGSYVGSMSETSSGTFTRSYTFSNDGNYTVYAYCQDEDGGWTMGTSRTIEVYADDDEMDDELYVPTVSPSSADEDERTEFTVRPSSDYNVTDCWLYVDGSRVTEMDETSTNVFEGDYTFNNSGSYSVYAYCQDSSGDTDTGDKRTVQVNDDDDDVEHGTLIKTPCGSYADSLDPCKAVYFYGKDGKRHVFPNESVYFTWYRDFDDVVEVSSNFMASLTIGKNVTYRPGSVLVQFQSSSSIYAVEKDHTLRRYTTTSLIQSDYGSNWDDNLVTVPDSLYSNYTIGSVIDSTGDYDRDDEYYSVDSIDDIL
ncbi:MAG: hypothetical protein AAB839_01765 [Patescibacteria group bacterium]